MVILYRNWFFRKATPMSAKQVGWLPVLSKKGKLPGQPTSSHIGTFPSIPATELGGVQYTFIAVFSALLI